MNFECPLCGLDFEGALCHSSCPLSNGCAMVRCPRCAYEFVQDGKLASLFRRLIRPRHAATGEPHATSPR